MATPPAAIEAAFITTSTTAAFFHDNPKSAHHKTSHSTTSPAEMGKIPRIRCSSINAGHYHVGNNRLGR